jgi:hypothetical protein
LKRSTVTEHTRHDPTIHHQLERRNDVACRFTRASPAGRLTSTNKEVRMQATATAAWGRGLSRDASNRPASDQVVLLLWPPRADRSPCAARNRSFRGLNSSLALSLLPSTYLFSAVLTCEFGTRVKLDHHVWSGENRFLVWKDVQRNTML